MADACTDLAHKPIGKLDRRNLTSHLALICKENVSLPFALRTQVLCRKVKDLMTDLADAETQDKGVKAAERLAQAIILWEAAEKECKDTDLKARNIWSCAEAQKRSEHRKGVIADAELTEQLESMGQAGGLRQYMYKCTCSFVSSLDFTRLD